MPGAVAESGKASAVRRRPPPPFFPYESGERGSKAAARGTVDKTEELSVLPAHRLQGGALFASHADRKTSAEAPAATGTEVTVTQAVSRGGKWTTLRCCQDAPPPWTSSWQIAARLHRLELVAVTLWDLKDLELSKATVGRPRTELEGLVSDRSRSARQD